MSKLDTDRESVDEGTFGSTVLTLMCKRVAYLHDLEDGDAVVDVEGNTYRDVCRLGLAAPETAPDSLKALLAVRGELVDSVDTTFPETFLPDLQTFLTSNEFLALYDNDIAIEATDDLIEMMRFMGDDAELAPALERLGHRIGYLPMSEALGGVRAFANYPELHEFLLTVIDQVTPGGQAKGEFDNLLAALGATLRNAEASSDPDSEDRTGRLVLDLLMSETDLLGNASEIPLVRRDYRGIAMVSSAGNTAIGFADMDNDGLADIDEQGRYVDQNGQLMATPAPFVLPNGEEQVPWQHRDAAGRALDGPDGAPLYEYVDLDRTLVSALARDGIELFDPNKGTGLDLLRGASALMSNLPRELVTRDYGTESLTYRGYDVSESPFLDMVHGYLQLLGDPNIYDVLELGRILLRDHEPEAARLVESVVDAAGIADQYPNAEVDPGAPLADDLVAVIRQILATPGLAEALMRSLEDPAGADLPMRFRDYMKFKDPFTYDADQNLVGSFGTPVDRTMPDRSYSRSLMQRLLHLISDSNGASMCNKQDGKVKFSGITLKTYDECELVQVDNLATFYVQAIAYRRQNGSFVCENGSNATRNASGYYRCSDGARPEGKARFDFNWNLAFGYQPSDAMIQDLTTIDGFKTHPTPEALNRVLFLNPPPQAISDLMDPAETKYGQQYQSVHAGTLPVWEKDNFYDQIQPVVQAFADRNAEQLFVDLMTVLHKHWASRQSDPTHQFNLPNEAGYVWGSNAVSYEAAIVEILERRETLPDRGNLMDALHYTAPVINGITARGKSSVTILTNAARYMMTPQNGLKNRRGDTTSETIEGDAITTLSPWQLIADAYALKRERLAIAGAEGEAWQRSTGNLMDVLVRGRPVVGVGWGFKNPRFRGISVLLMDFLESRLRAHDLAGDRAEWLSTDMPGRLEEVMTGPVFAGAADFILSLQASPEARAQLESLAAYLVNELNYNAAFRTSLSSIADVLQLALDDRDIVPIAHVIGEALRPERGWVESHLAFVKEARHSDANRALVSMMRNLYTEYRPGHTAIGDLIDGISEVHRERPYEDLGADYTAADYRSLLHGLARFLDDEKRGLRRFISIIKGRNL